MSKESELKQQINIARENLKQAFDKYYQWMKEGNYTKDLKEYAGKELKSIRVILDNGEVDFFGGYEIMNVTDDGHLYISDFDWGLLEYDSEEKAYVQWYHFQKSVYHIKGFFDIEVEDE